jgi:predicted ATPase/class 3 adenylate cyclase
MNDGMAGETGQQNFAFLLTDIEGSTGLWERRAAAMPAAIARHDAILQQAVSAAGGRVFKTTGDGMFAVFPAGETAITAAHAAQLALLAADFSAVGALKVRMAVHTGPASARDSDYFGPALNRAARLLAAAHGGQILISAAAALAGLPPGAVLVDLGSHRLKDLPQPESIYQLAAPGLPENFPPLASLDSHPHNLPVPATSFVGRDAETEAVIEALSRHRLVTLTGPGGAGKTRLALCVGERLLPRMPDGEWLVELAPLTADAQVPEALAALLGLSVQGANPALAIAQHLKPRRMLIILDNCEHLLPGAAALAEALVRTAPRLSILATSRERLGVTGEAVIPLASLAFPETGTRVTAETAAGYASIRLFTDRAALTGFAASAADLPAIADICRRLDGLPLTIELAAARTRMLTPDEILLLLKDRFKLLTGGARTAHARQQTLKTLIDWSFDLLSGPEKTLFRRCAVFGGSFGLDLVTSITAGDGLRESEVFDLLASLVDKSMVGPLGGAGGKSRFRLLESMRAYGLWTLTQAGEAPATHRRLVAEIHARCAEAEPSWAITKSAVWRPRYAPDIDNLRAALEWCFSAQGEAALGLALVARSASLWPELALTMERHRWAVLAAENLNAGTPPEIEARIHLILAGWGLPDKAKRQQAAARALDLFEALGDQENTALAAAVLANQRLDPANPTNIRAIAARAAAIVPNLPPSKRKAAILNHLATIAAADHDIAQAMDLTAQAYAIAKSFEDANAIETTGINLAEWLFQTGDIAGAVEKAEEVAASCRQGRDTLRRAYALSNLLAYHLIADNLGPARAAGREALPLHLANEDNYGLAVTLESMALLAARTGNTVQAAQLAGFAETYHRTHNLTRTGTEAAIHAALTGALGESPPHGPAWSNAEAVDAALEI